jgi:hypothetical protein
MARRCRKFAGRRRQRWPGDVTTTASLTLCCRLPWSKQRHQRASDAVTMFGHYPGGWWRPEDGINESALRTFVELKGLRTIRTCQDGQSRRRL